MSRESNLKNRQEALKLQATLAHIGAQGEHMRNQDRFAAMKMRNDREDTKTKNRNDAIKRSAEIEEIRYKNKSAIPTQHENNAQLFADIGKSFNGPGGRPRGKGAIIASSLAEGISHGLKSKAIDEKNANHSKFDRVMDYLQQVNNAALEQNSWYENRINAKASLMPQIMSYMNNVNTMDAQSRRFMVQDILEQYGNSIAENFKLVSMDGTNPFIATIESSKGYEVFDMRSLVQDNPMGKELVAEKMPEFQIGLQEQRANNEREALMQQQAMAQNPQKNEQNIPQSNEITNADNSPTADGGLEDHGNYYALSMDNMGQAAQDEYEKGVIASAKQVKVNTRVIEGIKRMQEVFKEYPNIGTSYINMINSGDEEHWDNWLKKNIVDKDELTALQLLRKESSSLVLSTVLGVPGKTATDLLKRSIMNAAPNGKLTFKAFDNISNTWINDATENINFIHEQLRGLQKGKMIINKGYQENGAPSPNNNSDNSVKRKWEKEQ